MLELSRHLQALVYLSKLVLGTAGMVQGRLDFAHARDKLVEVLHGGQLFFLGDFTGQLLQIAVGSHFTFDDRRVQELDCRLIARSFLVSWADQGQSLPFTCFGAVDGVPFLEFLQTEETHRLTSVPRHLRLELLSRPFW